MSLISRETVKCDIRGCESSFFEEYRLIQQKVSRKFLTLPDTWVNLNFNNIDYFICPMHKIVIQVDDNIIVERQIR